MAITVLKGSFKGEKKESPKGIFLLVFDENNKILSSDVLVTNDIKVTLPNITDRYNKFKDNFKTFSNNYLINSSITLPLRNSINTKFNKETIKKIKDLKKEELYGIINNWITDEIKEKLDTQVEKEEIEDVEYKKLIEKKERVEPKEIAYPPTISVKEEYEEIDIYLKAQIAIDEKNGKRITELLKSDKVLVRIVDERRTGEYLAKLLGARINSNLIPVVAEAEAAKEEKIGYRVIVKFGPGLFGETVIPKETKIKVLTEEEAQSIIKERKLEERLPIFTGSFTLTPIILFEIITLIILIALVGFWGMIK